MIKQKPRFTQRAVELGRYAFDRDEVTLSGLWCAVETEEEFEVLTEIYDNDRDVILAKMWTFEQGMLSTDIVNSRLIKYDINQVWRARYLLSCFREEVKPDLCHALHILDRLEGGDGLDGEYKATTSC